MTDTAQTATSAVTPTNTDGTAPAPAELTIQAETPVTAETPQADVDAVVTAALGDEYADTQPKPDEAGVATDDTVGGDEDATKQVNGEDNPTEDENKPDAKPTDTKPQKGYTKPDDKSAEDIAKEAKELEQATVETSDLFIEIQDADGNAVKISLDEGVPDDIKFANDKQLYDVMDAMREMRDIKNERQSELDAKKAEAQTKLSTTEAQTAQLKAWDAEIETLIDTGLLEAPKAEPGSAEFAEDPTVKTVSQVFDFMTTENEARAEAGKPLISSFGTAFTMLQNKNAKEAEAQRTKNANDEAKAAGSIVGGSSAAAGGDQTAYRPGQYHSIYDIPV